MIKTKPVQVKPVNEIVVVPPKVTGINPILAMQQHKANKAKPLDKTTKDIIEAGYHCGWSWTEIGDKLSEAGIHLSDETIQELDDALNAQWKVS